MPAFIDLTGQKFGRLRVIRRDRSPDCYGTPWVCLCECGNKTSVVAVSLRRGLTKSCGCFRRERSAESCRQEPLIQGRRTARLTHGLAHSPEYISWCSMLTRCNNPKATRYENYGGRGIKVCKRWQKFENFYTDMGQKPSPRHSIDRINNDGNYEPRNCQWASHEEQANNKRCNVRVTVDGESLTLAQASRRPGKVSHGTVRARMKKYGWTLDKAFNTPSMRKRKQQA